MNIKVKTKLLILLLIAALCTGILPVSVYASDPLTNHISNWPQMTDITPESAVVMDAANGGIIYSLNRDTKCYPASITKILTCLLVIENCKMTDKVTIKQDAVDVAIAGNSNINPIVGEEFTVEQCLYMLMLKSANDIAIALADQVAGSVSSFSDMMNERAKKLGCTGTNFVNPNGLPDENHYSTANDFALIMQECLKNDTFLKIAGTVKYTVPATNKTSTERSYENHNKLIVQDSEHYYQYCIAGKTGYTEAGARTLVAAAKKDGKILIAVTMKCATRDDFTDIVSLFNYGFDNFSEQKIDSDGYEGSVTLPQGIAVSDLTKKEGTDEDGNTVENYFYNDKLPVGQTMKTETVSAASSAAASVTSTDSKPAEVSGGNDTGILKVILIVLAVIIVLGIIIVVMSFVNRSRRKKRRRNQRKNQRRK